MSYQLTNEAAQDLEAILLDGMSRFWGGQIWMLIDSQVI